MSLQRKQTTTMQDKSPRDKETIAVLSTKKDLKPEQIKVIYPHENTLVMRYINSV